jgi:hypothetical protein
LSCAADDSVDPFASALSFDCESLGQLLRLSPLFGPRIGATDPFSKADQLSHVQIHLQIPHQSRFRLRWRLRWPNPPGAVHRRSAAWERCRRPDDPVVVAPASAWFAYAPGTGLAVRDPPQWPGGDPPRAYPRPSRAVIRRSSERLCTSGRSATPRLGRRSTGRPRRMFRARRSTLPRPRSVDNRPTL